MLKMNKNFELNIIEIDLIFHSLIYTLNRMEEDMEIYDYNSQLEKIFSDEIDILSNLIEKFLNLSLGDDIKCIVKEM